MDTLKEVLIDLIDPDFGLLDALIANGLICNRRYAEVRSSPTVYKRNERLLEFIHPLRMTDKFDDRFMEGLALTSQLHVVNLIKKCERNEESGDVTDVWPLSSKERQILNRNRFNLVNWIDPDHGLLDVLLSKRVISERQREFILSCPPRSEKVEAFLEILLRRSTRDLMETVKGLVDVNQEHLAKLLHENGVTIRIHIKNTEKFESKILPELRSIMSGRSADERWKMLELLQLSNNDIYVVYIERSASIVLYFYCLSSESLDHLHELWKSGRLTEYVEKIFRRMTSDEVDMKLELELNAVEYERLRKQLIDDEVDLEAQSVEPNARLKGAESGFVASAVFESNDISMGLDVTERDFLQRFSDLNKKVLVCAGELRQAVDTQVHSLKEEVALLKENFLELVRSRSEEQSHPLEEQEDLGKGRLRASGKGRSLSMGCASTSVMEDSKPSSIERATSLCDTQKKLNSSRSKSNQPLETEETPDTCSCVKLENLDTKEKLSFGVAYFQEKFYVICLESDTILAYKSHSPYTLEEEVTIEGMKGPHDMAASLSSLFITDSLGSKIWKVQSNHKSCVWMEEVGDPHTISITPNHQEVLLVCCKKPSTMKFFSLDATLRRSISLPSHIKKPTHAVALPNGHVILSHGGVGSDKQEICELSAGGEVIHDFQADYKSLSWPCHLAIDRMRGLVFVADFWNKRVLILNAKFQPVAEMPRESDSPWRICFVQELSQLLVGADGTVELYDVLCKA